MILAAGPGAKPNPALGGPHDSSATMTPALFLKSFERYLRETSDPQFFDGIPIIQLRCCCSQRLFVGHSVLSKRIALWSGNPTMEILTKNEAQGLWSGLRLYCQGQLAER